jgi:phospholipid/cholesterol/gamma-HCH transport system substrate-binding protein
VGGLGPALQRLVDSTTAIASDFKDNLGPVNDIIQNSTPILNSQVDSGDAISQWAANLNTITSQTAEQDQALRSGLQQAAPTADQLNAVFGDVREALPQTLANIAIVADLLKRYNKGLEQALVVLPQGATVAQAATIFEGEGLLHFGLSINQPPPCLTGFLPASEWRSPADTSSQPLPEGLYCKIPKDFQANVVRGARNYPCADVPGKRAASPEECRSDVPYEPLGTNPWYGDPNQILTCPAAGARCDQPVKPGYVIPAPSINNGLNPLPADQLPPKAPSPMSDPLTAPGQGTVSCSGQQPNPCVYTPASGPSAIYSPSSGEVMGPDGVTYSVTNSSNPGENGWKEMLAPAS